MDDSIPLRGNPRSVIGGHRIHSLAGAHLVGFSALSETVPPIVLQSGVEIVDHVIRINCNITFITQTFRATCQIIRK